MMPTKYLPLATWTLAGVGTSLTFIKSVRRSSHSRPRPSSLVVLFASSSSNESPKQQQQQQQRGEQHQRRREEEEEAAAGIVKKGDDDDDDDEECALPLLPLTNPNFDTKAKSLSGVLYARVISGINALYPPHELSNRNARSRTDGYWRYVARGERPPQEFTYGEFDVDFFGMLLDKSWEHYVGGMMTSDDDRDYEEKQQHSSGLLTTTPWRNKTFCDIGSGAGRLVFSAAALHPEFELCRGLEILDGLHTMSTSIADRCCVDRDDDEERRRLGIIGGGDSYYRVLRIPISESDALSCTTSSSDRRSMNHLPLAPIDFTCGSFADPYEYLGDIDCSFVFSSCMKPELVKELSHAIGRQCKPGTIIITTEFPLVLRGCIDPLVNDESMPHGKYEIQLLEKISGWCWLLGGESTAYIHRVVTSLWEEYAGPRKPPQYSLEEEAYGLVQLMEKGELTDTNAFLRKVRNDMIFHDLPHEFLPHID
jgi:hypothetical protein